MLSSQVSNHSFVLMNFKFAYITKATWCKPKTTERDTGCFDSWYMLNGFSGFDCVTNMLFFKHSIGYFQRRRWHPTLVLLPGKSHGQRSLVGCSPWGCEESDMTERLHFHVSLSCTGEGNGNPLQCSCLENPRDGGAWRAAVSGVAQSQTRLKRLSSSSSRETLIFFFFSVELFN